MNTQPDCVAHVHRVERAVYRKADLCVFSKPTVSRPHIHVTHTLAARTLLLLPAFPEQARGTLCSENCGVRNHQHLLSPQS